MIYQISDIKTQTGSLRNVSEELIQVRRIQAHIKELIADGLLPKNKWQFFNTTESRLSRRIE